MASCAAERRAPQRDSRRKRRLARQRAVTARWVRTGAALCLASVPALAQAWDVFGPLDVGVRVSQAQTYDQIWSTPARTGTGWTMVWSAGQDIVLRRFSDQLAPLSGDTLVNTTLWQQVQDEPAIGVAAGGNFLVAWSERYGYDGQQMGIFGRVHTASGTPLAGEFQINEIWQASQWRPLIAPTPAGGFVVAWSGGWDGDAFFRVLSSSGAPLGGDVRVNQFVNDAQVDPAVAAAPDGTIFVAFVDFSSHGNVGSGLNLWGRRFAAGGTPLGDEFPLPSTFVNGDQRVPRVAVDAAGLFTVVWQDDLADGAGTAIALRRFDAAGNALGPDRLVNTVTAGNQTNPVVLMDPDGSCLVAWEDRSTGLPRLRARRFRADGRPDALEFAASEPGLRAERPALAGDAASGAVWLGYDVANGTDFDVHARRFQETAGPQVYCTAKVNSQGCTPAIGVSGSPSLSSGAPFTIAATNVLSQKFGLMVYGFGSQFLPFQGGTLCVTGPRRTGAQFSGGTVGPPDCTGTFAFDFNAHVLSGADPALVPGVTVSAQWYYRDPPDPAGYGSGLTDAARFTICP